MSYFSRIFRAAAPLALVAGFALSGPASATTMVELTTDQLVDASTYIVRGTVVEMWTEADAEHNVWTRAQIELSEVLKGELDADSIVVDELGGTWGGRHTTSPGAVRYSVGEDVVLFLAQGKSGRLGTVGMTQGKLTVRLDPYSRSEIVQRYTVPLERAYDHRFLPLPAEADRVELDVLEQQVFDRVAAGWDGQPIPGISNERLRTINARQPGVK